jgi:hypothetical protein
MIKYDFCIKSNVLRHERIYFPLKSYFNNLELLTLPSTSQISFI